MNRNEKVNKAIEDGKVEIKEDEVQIIKDICAKYKVNTINMIMLCDILQRVGFGRNSETASLLRATADMIESRVETAETIEAKLDGKLQ